MDRILIKITANCVKYTFKVWFFNHFTDNIKIELTEKNCCQQGTDSSYSISLLRFQTKYLFIYITVNIIVAPQKIVHEKKNPKSLFSNASEEFCIIVIRIYCSV